METAQVEAPRVYTKKEEALIERYRDTNTDHNWWTGVYEQVKEELAEIGFRADEMWFSGFWSQGDGACFEGRMDNWTTFCANEPAFVEAFPFLSEFAKDEHPTYHVTHRGHYYNEGCTTHDYTSDLAYDVDQFDEDETDPEKQIRNALYKKALAEEGGMEDWLKEYFRDKMRDLYKRLEQEHDYLTSDDVVWESIEANEWDKQAMLDEEDDYAETTD